MNASGQGNVSVKPTTNFLRTPLFASTLVLTTFLVLMIVPGARWIVLQQMRWVLAKPHNLEALLVDCGCNSNGAPGLTSQELAHRIRLVDDHTAWFQVRLGAALTDDSCDGMSALRSLAVQYPNEPSAAAAYLDYASGCGSFILRRDSDEAGFSGISLKQLNSDFYVPPPPPIIQTQFEQFDQVAAMSERLYPTNAFFPVLRAKNMLVAHHDIDAIAEIERAGTLPDWNDYDDQAQAARIRAEEALFGRTSSVEYHAIAANMLYGYYSSVRASARVATYLAMKDERSGHQQQGFAIRRALMHTGGLMRTQSHNEIGSLVGIAVAAIPTTRPGGGPRVNLPKGMSSDQWTQVKRTHYLKYLDSINQRPEAEWARRELKAGDDARVILKSSTYLQPINQPIYYGLILNWILSMTLLVDLMWFILVGVASVLIAKLSADQKAWRKLWTALTLLSSFAVLYLFASNIVFWAKETYLLWQSLLQNISSSDLYSNPIVFFIGPVQYFNAAIIPILFVALIGTIAAMKKRSFAELTTRFAPWVAAILGIIYVASLCQISSTESTFRSEEYTYISSEGQYDANRSGQPWPGITPNIAPNTHSMD